MDPKEGNIPSYPTEKEKLRIKPSARHRVSKRPIEKGKYLEPGKVQVLVRYQKPFILSLRSVCGLSIRSSSFENLRATSSRSEPCSRHHVRIALQAAIRVIAC